MNIEIKRLNNVDKSDLIALMNNPMVRKHLPLAKGVFDDKAYDGFIAAKEKLWKEHGYGPWAFFFEKQFIGWGGLQYEEGDADFALILHPNYWGFGKAVFDLVIRQAFLIMGLKSITVLLPPSRLKLSVMNRLGFTRDGEVMLQGQRFLRFRLHGNADYVERVLGKG